MSKNITQNLGKVILIDEGRRIYGQEFWIKNNGIGLASDFQQVGLQNQVVVPFLKDRAVFRGCAGPWLHSIWSSAHS